MIQQDGKLSIRRVCELVEINRSSCYYELRGESNENLQIMRYMNEEHIEHPTHGVLQMQDFPFALGMHVNEKRVRRLLRLMGIMARYPQRNLSKLGKAEYIKPYLLRNLKVETPNQVWAIDITYIAMAKGFMYLTAIIDIHSRFVVGWALHNTLEADNCLQVLQIAIETYGKPKIVNSDQGSQFTCAKWVNYLQKEKIGISMDGKGRALDNVFIERFWRTLKQDYVYMHPATNGTKLFKGLRTFIHYYNNKKTHQGIERKRPIDLYQQAALVIHNCG